MTTISNWNLVAHLYHNDWANVNLGPFGSTQNVVELAKIKPYDKVLDLACGTGVVTKKISEKLGDKGILIGLDIANTPLKIANHEITYRNFHLVQMDSESMLFNKIKFNKITCQYAMMFFLNPLKVLSNIRNFLSGNGKLIIAVHGTSEKVPYFSSIMKHITRYIPNIRPQGTPNVHSLGEDGVLKKILLDSNYTKVKIYKKNFVYNAGTFEQYWNNYMLTTANSLKKIIHDCEEDVLANIKHDSEIEIKRYLKDKKIIFPWQVIISVAER